MRHRLDSSLQEKLADFGIVCQLLRQNVLRPLEGLLHALHPLFRLDKGSCGLLRRHILRLPAEDVRQGLQPLFTGGRGSGPPLGTVGAVQILHLGKRLGLGKLTSQTVQCLCRQLQLSQRCQNLLPALLQAPQIGQPAPTAAAAAGRP